MFDNNFDVESLPERIYEFCKIVLEEPIKQADLKNRIQPIAEETTSYFNNLRTTSVNLGLIFRREDGFFEATEQAKIALKDMAAFRRYCNSVVWKNDSSAFYKIAQVFLNSNERWLAVPNLTDSTIRSEVGQATGYTDERYLLGERFWLSFLGFGYVTESGNRRQILPNMYVALKDFMYLAGMSNSGKMEIKDFLGRLAPLCRIAFPTKNTTRLSLALSCALRQMHDLKEIELSRESDAKEVWKLMKFETHEITEEVTHIVVKKVR